MSDKIDSAKIIGVYTLSNTGSILVHAIEPEEDRVLASINGEDPQWCEIKDEYCETTELVEPGFVLGSFFVPFAEVMKMNGGLHEKC